MSNTKSRRLPPLGRVEQLVMDHIWAHGPMSAEACRLALQATWPMKDSTMRTVLRRLERKGHLAHAVEGRAFIYRTVEPRATFVTRAAKHIIDRFCGGSVEQFVLGLVDHAVLTPKQLHRLTKKIAERKGQKG